MIRTMINNKLRKQIRQAIPSYRGKEEILPLLADQFNIDDFCMLFVKLLPRQIVYELTKIGYKNLQNWLDRYYLRDIAYRGEKINHQTGKYEKQNNWLKKPYKRFYFQR